MKKIILASPRGFCAGVERAIQIVEKALSLWGSPLYIRHHIIHNEHIVKRLEESGVVFVDSLDEVPIGERVIFSAHGTAPEVHQGAKKRNLKVIDAACPLVTKIHREAVDYHKTGVEIVLIGHKGHQEVAGTMGYAPMHLVTSVQDVEDLEIASSSVAYLTQTTLSVDDSRDIIETLKKRFPTIKSPPNDDICYATTNRQAAVKELATRSDVVLVIGSEMSSNSRRLVETARCSNIPAWLVPDKAAVKDEYLKNVNVVGVTSGASVPEDLIDELVNDLVKRYKVSVEALELVSENVSFPLPVELG